MTRPDHDRVKSLEKGLRLLILLADQKSAVSLEELTVLSGLNKTTCFRLLKTMQGMGFVDQEPGSKRYLLGPRNIALGAVAMNRLHLRHLALPIMERLKDALGETINFSVLMGAELMFIERLEAEHILSAHHDIGDRLPVHCTCMGKAILAHLPPEKLKAVLDRIDFSARTDRTITSREALLLELERIRTEGLAYNLEELEKGLCAVAAPVLDYSGHAVAALNVSFPLMRHNLDVAVRRFAPQIKQAGLELSNLLGYMRERRRA